MLILGMFALTPALIVWLTAFKTEAEIVEGPLSFPSKFRIGNFVQALRQAHFAEFFLHSVLVAVPVVFAVLALSTLSGFAFARWDVPGSRWLLIILLLGLVVPEEAMIVPLYYQLRSLHLIDSLWGLILPQIGWGFAFGTFWMRAFFRSLGNEFTDAALIDGATPLQMVRYVVVPLARPALLTLGVLQFTFTWNEFLLPLVVAPNPDQQTLPLGLAFFIGRRSTETPLLMAAATLISAPVVIVFLFFQRHFIRGVLSGGIVG